MEKMLDPVRRPTTTFQGEAASSHSWRRLVNLSTSSRASWIQVMQALQTPCRMEMRLSQGKRELHGTALDVEIIPMTNEQIFNKLQQESPAERLLRPRSEGRESSIEEFKCKDILIHDFDTDLKTEIVWLHHENYWKKSLASQFQIDQFLINWIIKRVQRHTKSECSQ